jgi:hypothetical protein
MLCCTSIKVFFFSRPESGVICMTDDDDFDFVRIVATKEGETKEKRRQKQIVIGEK